MSRGPHSVPISHAAESIYTQGNVTFCSFLSVPGSQNFINGTHKSSPISSFFRGRVKNRKNLISVYRWPRNGSLFCDQVLPLFFRKSAKRSYERDFSWTENASKSDEIYAFRRAWRTIRTPRSGFQTGAQNHAKLRQNAAKIIAKWARKNSDLSFAMVKNACHRWTCENASKRVHFCRSRCCFAHSMDEKLIKIIENWPQNDHEKYGARYVNDQNRAPSTDLQKSIEMRTFLVFPVLLCSRYGFKNR